LEERPEGVEVSVELDLARHGLPRLVGIMDLVRKGGCIVDYKTTSRPPYGEKALHFTEVQTTSYAMLYREATDRQESGIELHHLVRLKTPKLVLDSEEQRQPSNLRNPFTLPHHLCALKQKLPLLDGEEFEMRIDGVIIDFAAQFAFSLTDGPGDFHEQLQDHILPLPAHPGELQGLQGQVHFNAALGEEFVQMVCFLTGQELEGKIAVVGSDFGHAPDAWQLLFREPLKMTPPTPAVPSLKGSGSPYGPRKRQLAKILALSPTLPPLMLPFTSAP
jgi:hypothetical protein